MFEALYLLSIFDLFEFCGSLLLTLAMMTSEGLISWFVAGLHGEVPAFDGATNPTTARYAVSTGDDIMRTNTWISIIVSMMANAVIFGVGAIAVLSIPALNEHAKYLLPIVVVVSFVLSPFVGKIIAPHMRSPRWKREHGYI